MVRLFWRWWGGKAAVDVGSSGMETDADKLQLAQPRSESCIREVQTEVVCTGSRTWKMKRKKHC